MRVKGLWEAREQNWCELYVVKIVLCISLQYVFYKHLHNKLKAFSNAEMHLRLVRWFRRKRLKDPSLHGSLMCFKTYSTEQGFFVWWFYKNILPKTLLLSFERPLLARLDPLLARLDIEEGVKQPFSCLIVQNRQAV